MIKYWFELRRRLLWCVSSYLFFFTLYFLCFDSLYQFITSPMVVGNHGMLVSQDIIGPLVLPVELSASLSLLTVMPIILFQLLSFARPALYPQEKRIIDITCVLAVGLFYVGAAISFWLVEPAILAFVQSWMPKGIMFLPTISSYLAFSLDMAVAFGVAFEIPVILMVLVTLDWVSVEWVKSKRPWWVVGLFVLAMILTPPDVYSQVILAIPMWGLIELVLLMGKYLKRHI